MGNFQGRRIVLTGATRGVGFESAKLFLAAGAQVLGTGRDAARLEKSTAELSKLGTFHPCLADFDDLTAPETVAKAARKLWPAVDLLINNAAVQTYKAGWADEGLELLDHQWRCNVFAPQSP